MLLKEEYFVNGNTVLKPQIKEKVKVTKKVDQSKYQKKKTIQTRNSIIKAASTLFIIGAITVTGQAIVTNAQYDLNTLKDNKAVLVRDNEDLKLQKMKIDNISNIEETSKGLNMKKAYIDEFAFTDLSKNNFKPKEVPQKKVDKWFESIKKIFS